MIWTFACKVMSLHFNMLSRFVTAFLPWSKYLLISWLQSRSTVVLEPKKIKSISVNIFSPSICHEEMGSDFVANRWGNSGNSGWLHFSGLQNHWGWWLQPWNEKTLAPSKKRYDKPRKHTENQRHHSTDKGYTVKAMVFHLSWVDVTRTIKKAEHKRIDAFQCGAGEDS